MLRVEILLFAGIGFQVIEFELLGRLIVVNQLVALRANAAMRPDLLAGGMEKDDVVGLQERRSKSIPGGHRSYRNEK